jgi:glycosyltransferase 2 family protein
MSKIRLLVAATISLGLLVLTFRGLNWGELLSASRTVNYWLIISVSLLMILMFGVRALRWSYLLRPMRRLTASSLFPIVLIGFFGNYVLPAKTGELIRAYVLSKREQLSKSMLLGSIAVEKVMDMLILFVLLLGTLWLVPQPGWIFSFEEGAAVILVGLIAIMFGLAARGRWAESLIVRVLQFVFPWWKERLAQITHSFVDGLSVLHHVSSMGTVIVLSALIWSLTSVFFALIGRAMHLDVPLYVYVIVAAITNMASLVPSMPGRLGTLEFLSVTVLTLFGVAPSIAVLFPILLRIVQLVPVLLGYFFLNREGVRIFDVQKVSKETGPVLP